MKCYEILLLTYFLNILDKYLSLQLIELWHVIKYVCGITRITYLVQSNTERSPCHCNIKRIASYVHTN